MNIHSTLPSPALLRDTDAADRFCYWRGQSGKRYIHSVYPLGTCPPLPGAVYIAVRRNGGSLSAVSIGRFPAMLDRSAVESLRRRLGVMGVSEIHVHLLAKGEYEAEAIKADLERVLHIAGNDLGALNLAA